MILMQRNLLVIAECSLYKHMITLYTSYSSVTCLVPILALVEGLLILNVNDHCTNRLNAKTCDSKRVA